MIKEERPQTSRIQFQKTEELLARGITNVVVNRIEEALCPCGGEFP